MVRYQWSEGGNAKIGWGFNWGEEKEVKIKQWKRKKTPQKSENAIRNAITIYLPKIIYNANKYTYVV